MGPKKFGLLTKKQAFGSSAAPAPKALLNSGFGEDSDSDDGSENGRDAVSQSILAQAAKKKRLQEETLRKEGGEEVYDYDKAHEEIRRKREEEERKKQEEEFKSRSKSKYIGGLLEQTAVRERERERAYERKMVKEAAAEEAIYGDKEKFVTSSYKRKLAEREKWDKEDEKVKQKEEENAVEKKGMGAFYANMNKNVSMGAPVEEDGEKNSKSKVPAKAETTEEAVKREVSDISKDVEMTKDEKKAIEQKLKEIKKKEED
eukprot:CAMPEP_0182508886 /NCGR_PEP_ID=MMETSP1321-20130603/25798_1 /TAXON_ID=91990 /ORGANISM="Bolidomonas sp., Strain RCC1657" /LENGTH=259 /DNA_ID=CAMNT_0024715031 /DNA_START=58 /DNA_END=834 /DNA_ORIENTATION=+